MAAVDESVTDLLDTGNPAASATLKTILLGGPSALLLRGSGGARPSAPVKPLPPTTAELFKQGSQAFTTARKLGDGIKPESTIRLGDDVMSMKESSGLSLRINETLHPKSHGARQEIMSTLEKGEVTFDDLVELRQIAQEAAGAVDKGDALRGQVQRNPLMTTLIHLARMMFLAATQRRRRQILPKLGICGIGPARHQPLRNQLSCRSKCRGVSRGRI